jgi:acetylornithine deacetylase/succinyl-diaminopimelate desuccinylase-like protein
VTANSLEQYLSDNRERQLAELMELLAIPSISTEPDHAPDIRRAAGKVQQKLAALGFESRLYDTARHPLVYGEYRVSADAPTVLIYGHYDVQPPEPLEGWNTPPFEPVVREGKIWARGASDDKGQFLAHIMAAEALLAVDGTLPVNLKFLIEGEEEIGSPSLDAFIGANRELLAADAIIVSDGAMIAPDTPSLTYGLRGLAYIEVHLRTANRDLHSGAFGGAAPNPLNILSRIIAQLHDDEGRVAVPGFYDAVDAIGEAERQLLRQVPFNEERFLDQAGIRTTAGEPAYSVLERIWTRPTLDVNGIKGGFQGEGSKTVIPATAMAKISCRLVPGQDHVTITRLLGEHIRALAPEGVEVEIIDLHGGQPALTPLESPAVTAAAAALAEVYGREPVFIRTGGTIPVVNTFQQQLHSPVVLFDLGLETDKLHAPNEHFSLSDYYLGIHVSALLLHNCALINAPDSSTG